MARKQDISLTVNWRGNHVLKALKDATRETIKEAVDLVASEAKKSVPVRSGTLRDSIKGRVRKARGQDMLIGSVSTNTKGKSQPRTFKTKSGVWVINPKVAPRVLKYGYGADVEGASRRKNYTSTPYLRPAMQRSIPAIQEILKKETNKRSG